MAYHPTAADWVMAGIIVLVVLALIIHWQPPKKAPSFMRRLVLNGQTAFIDSTRNGGASITLCVWGNTDWCKGDGLLLVQPDQTETRYRIRRVEPAAMAGDKLSFIDCDILL